MKTFSDVTRTQKETAVVLIISLTFITILVSSLVIPNIISRGLLRQVMFYIGSLVLGLLGFLALEILASLSFLGDGAKFGSAGFVLMLIIGAFIGGKDANAFLSGVIVGLLLFYVKSMFAIIRILMIETVQDDTMLTITEYESKEKLNHFMIEGIGANFELLYYIIDEFRGKDKVMFYARSNQQEINRLDQMLGDTMRFYANHMLPLHRIESKRKSNLIKQMCFECSSPEIIERGLINYWLRAHLNGGYTCVLVPYDTDFLEKAAVCEGSYEEGLDFERVIGDEEWLITMASLMGGIQSHQEIYTTKTLDEVMETISKVHPVG